MSAYVLEKLCRGCQRCIHTCPQGAIQMIAHLATVDPAKCVECEECMEACMFGAITFREDVKEAQSNV